MANTGTLTGSVIDGNTRADYEITYEVSGSSVCFTACTTGTYRYAAYSNSEHTYIYYGNANEHMTLVVDGTPSTGERCLLAMPYGTHAIRSGWVAAAEPSAEVSLTVPLKGGSYTVELMFTGNGGKSDAYSLVLAGASTLSLSGSREIGSAQMLTLHPAAPGLLHTVSFDCGESSGVIKTRTADTELLWTPPYALVSAFPDTRSIPVVFTVSTFSGTECVGTSECQETLTVPDNDTTRPALSIVCTAQNDGLPAAFAGMFISARSRVRTDFTAEAKLGASPVRYASLVNGAWSEGNPALSAPLSASGTTEIFATVEDSRGLTASAVQSVTVWPYAAPAVVPYPGDAAIGCERCASEGTPDAGGTNLRLRAARQYSDLGGANGCTLEGRIKLRSASDYGAWFTLLAPAAADSIDTVLPGVVPDTHAAYDIELRCTDTLGESGTLHLIVLTDETPLHLARGGGAVGLGRYADPSRGHSVQFGWPAHFDNGVYVGEHALPDLMYPVGSLYRSTDGDFTPAALFGGAWSYRGETDGVHEWNRIS